MKLNPTNTTASIDPVLSGYQRHGLQAQRFGAIAFESDDGTGGSTPPATPPATPPEDVAGLKSALDKERQANKAAAAREKEFQEKLAKLEESFKGIDPEKYKEFEQLRDREEARNKEFAEMRQTLESQFQQKLQTESAQRSELEKELASLKMRYAVEKAYGAVDGSIEAGEDGVSYFDLFYSAVSGYLKPNETGGIDVVDSAGLTRYSGNGKPMGLSEFFETYKSHPVLSNCFPMKNPPKGGGSVPSVRTAAGVDLSTMSPADQITYIRQKRAQGKRI